MEARSAHVGLDGPPVCPTSRTSPLPPTGMVGTPPPMQRYRVCRSTMNYSNDSLLSARTSSDDRSRSAISLASPAARRARRGRSSSRDGDGERKLVLRQDPPGAPAKSERHGLRSRSFALRRPPAFRCPRCCWTADADELGSPGLRHGAHRRRDDRAADPARGRVRARPRRSWPRSAGRSRRRSTRSTRDGVRHLDTAGRAPGRGRARAVPRAARLVRRTAPRVRARAALARRNDAAVRPADASCTATSATATSSSDRTGSAPSSTGSSHTSAIRGRTSRGCARGRGGSADRARSAGSVKREDLYAAYERDVGHPGRPRRRALVGSRCPT